MRKAGKKEPQKIEDTAGQRLIRKAITNVLRTRDGKVLWAWLHQQCSFTRTVMRVSRTTGDVAPLSTEAAEAQRLIYLDLRNMVEWEVLRAAEEYAERDFVKLKEEGGT